MPQAAISSSKPLDRTEVLCRAGLVAFVAFAGVHLAISGLYALSHGALARLGWWLWITRFLVIPVAFAVTWWRLRPRMHASAAPRGWPFALAAAAGIGLVGWAVGSLAWMFLAKFVYVRAFPEDVSWTVAILSFLVSWARLRPRESEAPAHAPIQPRRVPFAVVAAAFHAGLFMFLNQQMAPAYPVLSHVLVPWALLMAWVAFERAARGETLWQPRSRKGKAGLVVLLGLAGLIELLVS